MDAKSVHSCPTLCDCMHCSSPGSSIHVILHARILEWATTFSSKEIFPAQGLNLHLLNWQADSLPLTHLGSVALLYIVFYYVGIPLFIYPFCYPWTLVYFLFYATTICIAMKIVKEGEYLFKYFFALRAFLWNT